MSIISNPKLMSDFILGLQVGKANTMEIRGTTTATALYSYATPIAIRDSETGQIYIDARKYSVPTSKQQTQLRRLAEPYGYAELSHEVFRTACKDCGLDTSFAR